MKEEFLTGIPLFVDIQVFTAVRQSGGLFSGGSLRRENGKIIDLICDQ